MRRFNYKKAVQALNLLATLEGGAMNKMKALKLLWLSDRLHLRKYGRPIVQDLYVAMENGPVPSGTRDILQNNLMGVNQETLDYSSKFISPSGYDFKSINEPNEKVFSVSDLEALRTIYATYGKLEKYELRDLTHEFPEWKRWEDGLKTKEYKSHEMDYDDFFLSAGDKHKLFIDDEEGLQLVRKLYLRKD